MEAISEMEKEFKQIVLSHAAKVQKYKDENLLEKALQMIPVEELTIRATQNLSKLDNVKEEDSVSLDDLIVMELMLWFKGDFFSWVNSPSCKACGGQTIANPDPLQPTLEESQWEVRSVEGYRCVSCGGAERFPRYNHPGKLLEERRGRCGEWANCFALLLYAMGREARLAFDFNDHVWVEVYSSDREEWLHIDPCESAFDTPLLYEKGWKKPITHVVAFSVWEVQDVTWRYTSNFAAVLERRKKCREEFVEDLIWSVNEKLQSGLTSKEKDERRDRTFHELMQFLTPKKDDGSSYGGRTSGSLAWRTARGETGGAAQNGYVFHTSPREAENKLFQLTYSCTGDKYLRPASDTLVIEGWENGVFEHSNIFRKKEIDWKQVYLCRTEGSEQGFLEWKFDFSDSGLTIDQVTLSMPSVTFETGRVMAYVWPGLQKTGQGITFDTKVESSLSQHLQGQCGFILRLDLSGGNGQVAWQHAQLFRQGLMDVQLFPFQLKVTFSDKGKS